MEKLFNDFITNHNKMIDLYLVKLDFIVFFIDFTPHIKTDFHHNTSFINLKRYLLL